MRTSRSVWLLVRGTAEDDRGSAGGLLAGHEAQILGPARAPCDRDVGDLLSQRRMRAVIWAARHTVSNAIPNPISRTAIGGFLAAPALACINLAAVLIRYSPELAHRQPLAVSRGYSFVASVNYALIVRSAAPNPRNYLDNTCYCTYQFEAFRALGAACPHRMMPERRRLLQSGRAANARGEVVENLNEAEVKAPAKKVNFFEIEAVAICLINGYANLAHDSLEPSRYGF